MFLLPLIGEESRHISQWCTEGSDDCLAGLATDLATAEALRSTDPVASDMGDLPSVFLKRLKSIGFRPYYTP